MDSPSGTRRLGCGRACAIACALSVAVLAPASSVAAKPGRLDRTFGDRGVVSSHFNAQLRNGVSVVGGALQPDGRIVVAGGAGDYFSNFSASGFIARYEPTGARDPSFGTGGLVMSTQTLDAM